MLLTRNYQDKTYVCVDTSSIKVDVYEKRTDGQPTRTCVLQSRYTDCLAHHYSDSFSAIIRLTFRSGPVMTRSESIANEKYASKAFQLRVAKYLGGMRD